MSNTDAFCKKLDDFGKGLEQLLEEAQMSVMMVMETYIILNSPRPGVARFATGQYLESHRIRKIGRSLVIAPNTDHDIHVEEGKEGGWWPKTSGYGVYTMASAMLKKYERADLVTLARTMKKNGYTQDLKLSLSNTTGKYYRNDIERFYETGLL